MKLKIIKPLMVALAAFAMLGTLAVPVRAAGPVSEKSTAGTSALANLFRPRSFVYVLTNPTGPNAVDAFARNRITGKLTYRGRFATLRRS